MKRAQSTLEISFLIGVVAVAITAMLAYINRGFQGNIRTSADQIGSGHYEPGKVTKATNSEIKDTTSSIVSTSKTTIQYGNGGSENEEMQANREEQESLRAELALLEEAKLGTSGNNVYLNQTSTDIATGIVDTHNQGMVVTQTAVGEAIGVLQESYDIENLSTQEGRTRILTDLQEAIDSVQDSIDSLTQTNINLNQTISDLENADYGCDGMPGSVRQQIIDLRATVASNEENITDLRTTKTSLEARRDAIANGTADVRVAGTGDLGTDIEALAREYGVTIDEVHRDDQISPVRTPEEIAGMTLDEINDEINRINDRLSVLADDYEELSDAWNSRTIVSDQTTSTSSNSESGKTVIMKTTDEKLDSF